jgi:protein-disulfide isomerase
MSKKTWIIFGIIVVSFIGGMLVFSESNKINLDGIDLGKIIPASDQNGNTEEHVKGSADSKVVLVEYGDYQCAGCASVYKRINSIAEDYKNELAVVFRNYTIDGHQNALSAAAAAESANLQGKFWEMHNLIYDNQTEWSNAGVTERNDLYLSYAKQLGLDETKFTEGMKDTSVRKKIEFDKSVAKAAGLDSTPYFILNGEKIDYETWSDDDKLRELIDKVLKDNGITPPTVEKSE